MQLETGFPSSHQLKSYVASKSRLKLAARGPVSGCWLSCHSTSGRAAGILLEQRFTVAGCPSFCGFTLLCLSPYVNEFIMLFFNDIFVALNGSFTC